jgi:hypothetical protein
MTLRRYAAILPVLIVLVAAAIFFAANGQEGARAADTKSAQTPQTGQKKSTDSTDSSSDTWGTTSGDDSSDTWGDDSSDNWGDSSDDTTGDDSGDAEGDIGPGGSTDGGSVLTVGETENVAAANRLSSVKVIKSNTDDNEEEWVRFCFRDGVQNLDEGKSASFAVIGPDPSLGETATDVTLDDAHKNCVLAGFDSDSDVRSYTLGAVEGGVVKNRDDEKNIADSVKLDGGRSNSARNRTSGPDLTGVRVSKSLNRVEYYFDEDLDENGSADAGSFGFYTERGDARTASDVVSVDGHIVTVKFDSDDQVDNARRGFVEAGAVQDTGGSDNPVGEIGGRTSNPDLTGVSKSGADTQYDFTFDDNVSDDVDASDFVLVTDNATEIEGESADVDGKKVHVTFSRDIEDYDADTIVLAAVKPDVTSDSGADSSDSSDDDTDEQVTLGVKKLGSSNTRAGRTTGPDLVSISTDANDRRMTLTFDEKLDEDNDDDASGIYIDTDDDSLVAADSILQVDGKKVYVQADENLLDSLVGVTLEPDTIEDNEGNGNPIDTVAHGSAHKLGTTNSLYGHSYGHTR